MSDILKPQVYNWYIGLRTSNRTGEEYNVLRGNVWGSDKFIDSAMLTTSIIRKLEFDYDRKLCIVTTHNSVYYCPMEYCNVEKQERKYPGRIPDEEFVKILDIVENRTEPTIDDGKILITLSTFDFYYFHSLYYRKPGEDKPAEYEAHEHIGSFQDSFLISSWRNMIDLRYFPHSYAISFYSWNTEGLPVYLENIGFDTIHAETPVGVIKLESGDRKLVAEENAEQNPPVIHQGDLYPAAFF